MSDFTAFIANQTASKFPITNDLVKAAIAKRQAETDAALIDFVGGFIKNVERHTKHNVNALRACRKQEKELKTRLDEINAGVEYFNKTSNPFPLMKTLRLPVHDLCYALQIDVPGNDSPLWKMDGDLTINAEGDEIQS